MVNKNTFDRGAVQRCRGVIEIWTDSNRATEVSRWEQEEKHLAFLKGLETSGYLFTVHSNSTDVSTQLGWARLASVYYRNDKYIITF